MKSSTRRKTLLAAGIIALVAAAAVAVAAWQTSGSGPAYAKAQTAATLTLGDASASTSADLYPGATGALTIKITNPNPFPIKITTVALQTGGVVTSNKGPACDASTGVSVSNQTGLAIAVGASTTSTVTVPNAVSMSNASDNSCQGAVFTVPVDVTAVSS
ncbi:MAG TPA: hypothetical protein VGQ15_14345 [Gaiellaceae bacterium]|nr:hypothetical protein [Gaiellaceae bacterium]